MILNDFLKMLKDNKIQYNLYDDYIEIKFKGERILSFKCSLIQNYEKVWDLVKWRCAIND